MKQHRHLLSIISMAFIALFFSATVSATNKPTTPTAKPPKPCVLNIENESNEPITMKLASGDVSIPAQQSKKVDYNCEVVHKLHKVSGVATLNKNSYDFKISEKQLRYVKSRLRHNASGGVVSTCTDLHGKKHSQSVRTCYRGSCFCLKF